MWKSNILIEFKSCGKDLEKAHQQAKDYFPGLKDSDLPKSILVCDFERFRLYDLEESTTVEFKLSDLVNNVQHFAYLLGYQRKVLQGTGPGESNARRLSCLKYMSKFNDIHLENWRECDVNTDPLWMIQERTKTGKHKNIFHGNFIPQIPDPIDSPLHEKR